VAAPGQYWADAASIGPVLGRCCQHRPSTDLVLPHNDIFTEMIPDKQMQIIEQPRSDRMVLIYQRLYGDDIVVITARVCIMS